MTDMRILTQTNKGFFNFAGLQVEEVLRLKELSTCNRCRQPVNTYVMIWPLQMQVCEKCYSRIHLWGLSILKRLLGFVAGEKA